jgi:glucose-6-phosphate 1-dehydrogenase
MKPSETPQLMETDQKVARSCVVVIFGITGDLTKRLLYPAICNLGSSGLLPDQLCVLGVASKPYNNETFREYFSKEINQYIQDSSVKKFGQDFLKRVYYLSGDFKDHHTYTALKEKLTLLSQIAGRSYLFYLAVPPEFLTTIALGLSHVGLLAEEPDQYFRELVVEKPYGHDLPSAKKLNQVLLSVAKERQIFRIDHFLGKETVQNIFTFRFSNDILEPIWNHHYIDNVQITVAETLGVELRGRYYEQAGALRDMVPNHLFQVLSFVAMEPPVSFTTRQIQEEKVKVIQAIEILSPKQVRQQTARGQYGSGQIKSVDVVGYRSEKFVDPESVTETYAAMKLFLNNWRWLHVPFYLRTGKRMKVRTSQVDIQFKSDASCLFKARQKILPNVLRIFIQPDEGISWRFNAKVPSYHFLLGQVEMNFRYRDYFGIKPQTGYEAILYECINGQRMLFKSARMVESCWEVVQPILDVWGEEKPTDFPNYPAGTWGPPEADWLLQKDGRKWL